MRIGISFETQSQSRTWIERGQQQKKFCRWTRNQCQKKKMIVIPKTQNILHEWINLDVISQLYIIVLIVERRNLQKLWHIVSFASFSSQTPIDLLHSSQSHPKYSFCILYAGFFVSILSTRLHFLLLLLVCLYSLHRHYSYSKESARHSSLLECR